KNALTIYIDTIRDKDKLEFLPRQRAIIIRVEGRIVAFSLGGFINEASDEFVTHFEKADDQLRGAYQAINLEMARSLPEGIRFINREEDMGILSLRRAKESYKPIKRYKKLVAILGE
ncbi:MAG: DUF2156 domain-containing protein, partial [Enterococcus sp.]|nr:DUF2156 domain-containing protein [Enterococcus sp.]